MAWFTTAGNASSPDAYSCNWLPSRYPHRSRKEYFLNPHPEDAHAISLQEAARGCRR